VLAEGRTDKGALGDLLIDKRNALNFTLSRHPGTRDISGLICTDMVGQMSEFVYAGRSHLRTPPLHVGHEVASYNTQTTRQA
jgi:hypothetical protein